MAKWQSVLGAVLGSIIGGPVLGITGYHVGNTLSDLPKLAKGAVTGSPSNTQVSQSPYDNANDVLLDVQNGKITALEAFNILSRYFPASLALNPNLMKMLNELISREDTANAQDYESYLMQNGLLWNASQLQQLGLSNSGVLSTGASIPNVAAADTDFSNPAERNVEMLSHLANNFISMSGRMASAGIYGSALKAVRSTAGKFAAQSAHSAVVPRPYKSSSSRMSWDQLLDDME